MSTCTATSRRPCRRISDRVYSLDADDQITFGEEAGAVLRCQGHCGGECQPKGSMDRAGPRRRFYGDLP